MTISSEFYKNDIRQVLKSGGLKLQQIKSKLEAKGIKLDETQILNALEGMIKTRIVNRAEGRFHLASSV